MQQKCAPAIWLDIFEAGEFQIINFKWAYPGLCYRLFSVFKQTQTIGQFFAAFYVKIVHPVSDAGI